MKHNYSDIFFDYIETGSVHSAQQIVPIIYDNIQFETLIDIGCGRGAWLSVFNTQGNAQCFGMDGDYIVSEHLMINKDTFITADLNEKLPIIHKKYDLAMSLEVAEHLKPERSQSFIDDLCRLSDVVMFSAATVGQGGEHHINERPLEDWRHFFNIQGYQAFDFIRPLVKDNQHVEPWYKYNILLYVNQEGQKRLSNIILKTRISNNEKIIEGGHYGWRLRKFIVKFLSNSIKTLIAKIISYRKSIL